MEETSPSLGWGRSQTCTHWGCRDFCQSVEPCTEGIRRATQRRRSRGQCQGREALLRAQRPPQLLSPSCCTCWSSTWIMQSFINSDSCVHKQFLQKWQKAFLITYLVLEQVHITASMCHITLRTGLYFHSVSTFQTLNTTTLPPASFLPKPHLPERNEVTLILLFQLPINYLGKKTMLAESKSSLFILY